jgi:hypothetical protein
MYCISDVSYLRLICCINAFIFCVHYSSLIGRVYVLYVGHVDKSCLYETLFQCDILSKHPHHLMLMIYIYSYVYTYIYVNMYKLFSESIWVIAIALYPVSYFLARLQYLGYSIVGLFCYICSFLLLVWLFFFTSALLAVVYVSPVEDKFLTPLVCNLSK